VVHLGARVVEDRKDQGTGQYPIFEPVFD